MRLLALFVRRHEIGPSDIVDHPIIFLVLVGRAYGSTGPTSKTNNEMFAVDSQGCNQSYGLVREGADSFQDSSTRVIESTQGCNQSYGLVSKARRHANTVDLAAAMLHAYVKRAEIQQDSVKVPAGGGLFENNNGRSREHRILEEVKVSADSA